MNTQELERLQQLLRHAEKLNSAEFILTHELSQIKKLCDEYKINLQNFLQSIISKELVGSVVSKASKQYARAMNFWLSKGLFKKRFIDKQALIQSILDSWNKQAEGIAKRNSDNLFSKAIQFRTLATAYEIPIERFREIQEYEIIAARVGPMLYKYKDLKSLWSEMTNTYGETDTIQFRNGVNFPLRTYVDARKVTTQSEAHRLTTIIEAASDGIWFGTTSRTGTTDSCIFHEGEVFFITETAREQAIIKYGKLPNLLRMRTWQEIVADETHMGKFNCRHTIRPYPIQFLQDDKAKQKIKNLEFKEIPKKIDERKIFEQITGRKWVQEPRQKRQETFDIFPVRKSYVPIYTIA